MKYYISITGMQLKSILYLPKFVSYTMPSMKQAKNSIGNISAQGNHVNNTVMTLTVWEDRKSMTKFMASGYHAKAMKIIHEISTPDGATVYGYESDTIPTWKEAIEIWKTHGRRHGNQLQKIKKPTTTTTENKIDTKRQRQPQYSIFSIILTVVLATFWWYTNKQFQQQGNQIIFSNVV